MATPTYYGPVTTSGSSSTTVGSQTEGSLAVFVQQPCDQSPMAASDGSDLVTEEWKGPYSVMSKLQFQAVSPYPKLTLGMTAQEVHAASDSNWVKRFDFPGDQTKMYLDEFSVRQLDSGDHGILRLVFKFQSSSPSPTPEEVPGSEVWNVSWQPYNLSPYAFCANVSAEAKYASDPNAGEADKATTAYAQHIKDCIQQPAQSGTQLKQYYCWMNSTTAGKMYTLDYMERRIMEKVMDDLSPTYHFPIVTKSVTFQDENASIAFNKTLGQGIDVALSSLPEGCPYTFDSAQWKAWLKVGDNVSMSRKVQAQGTSQLSSTVNTYTRTETWWGATSFDPNFYAPASDWTQRPANPGPTTRWLVGKM